ncbi:unnamed protein product [Linum tenue]|uniref:1,8-cineole synthase n=1 Tax=Linum tenue TaxID=586396 RepID=A0AAV0LNT8_9ROSI|nr:unnamed protein product [Linum tenue]
MDESPPASPVPLILNLVTSMFIYADRSLLQLADKYKLLELLRYVVVTSFLFLLRLIPSMFPSFDSFVPFSEARPLKASPKKEISNYHQPCLPSSAAAAAGCDSSIARALSQLLAIANEIPVSSRKYEIVRSLAEKMIDDNHRENVEALHEINRTVLSAAFSRSLAQLGAAMGELGLDRSGNGGAGQAVMYKLNRALKAVRSVGDGSWGRTGYANRSNCSAEKLAAELLWLAQKLAACGCVEEAVWRWAMASKVAWLALSAEPRLQGSLVKVSAFLFKHAKDLGLYEIEESKKVQWRRTKLEMLTSWLPLLCRATTAGVDVPVLGTGERADLEKVMEEMLEMLEQEEKEAVLFLWLQHFSYAPSSDWPNLHDSYSRWCNASRRLLVLQ